MIAEGIEFSHYHTITNFPHLPTLLGDELSPWQGQFILLLWE